jgi:hypothetical protein
MARNNAAGESAATSDDVEDKGTDLETALDNELSQSIEDALNVDDDEELDEDDLDDDDEDLDDDDEDLDDDDDEDDDEGEGELGAEKGDAAEGAAAAVPAAGGETKGAAAETKPAAGDTKAVAGDTKSATAKPAEGAPKWEPFSVNVDKQPVTIEEASIQRANGVVYIGMKEEQFARFQQRISRGVVGERMWRQLQDGLKELDVQRSAPARESDAEIEARLTYEALKPHVKDFLDDRDVELLEAKIELAKANSAKAYSTAETARAAKAKEVPWEAQQATALEETARGIVAADPELAGLSSEEIDDVIQNELLPVRAALITRDDAGEMYGNTQYVFDRLKARASNKKTGANATAAGAAPSKTPATTGNSSTTASSATDKRADRFNRGVDAAPRSTSFAARRGESRPANGATRRSGRRGGRKLTPQQDRERAEDRYRKKERDFLKSPGLDFGS